MLGFTSVILANAGAAQYDVSISTKIGSDREIRTKERLSRILDSYDVSNWVFTTTVVIDESSIPHSHPVLTLNTRHSDDLLLLSSFVHEQIHWYLVAVPERTDRAIADLERMYQEVPIGGRKGGKDARSTYLHMLVNYLEFQAMKLLIGNAKARDLMEFWATDHYTWVYRTVLNDASILACVIAKFDLEI